MHKFYARRTHCHKLENKNTLRKIKKQIAYFFRKTKTNSLVLAEAPAYPDEI